MCILFRKYLHSGRKSVIFTLCKIKKMSMKKVLLFVCACLFSMGMFAQVKTIDVDDVTLTNNGENYQSQEIIFTLDAPIAVDDVVSVSLSGKISDAVDGLKAVLIECSTANSWGWDALSDYQEISGALSKGDIVDIDFDLKATSVSIGNEIRLYFMTTNAPVAGVSSISINGTGVAPEPAYEDPVLGVLASVWGAGNKVEGKTMTFGESDSGIGFANYDASGFNFGDNVSLSIVLEEFPTWATYGQIVVVDLNNNNSTVKFEGATAVIDLTAIEGGIKQIYLQCGGTGNVTLKEITLSNETPIIPEEAYVDPILGTLAPVWGDGNAVAGKTMTFGESNSGIGFANYDGGFDLSQYESITIELEEFPTWAEYGQIVVMSGADGKTSSMFAFEGTVATVILAEIDGNAIQIYLQCGGTGDVTLKEITFNEKGSETAVENVAGDSFSIEGGMVFSKGTINVYDINGKYLQSSDKELNVNNLNSGSYIINAQEGSIKFVK